MQNSCPSCGAETFPGARFCRRCGAPVGGEVGGETGDVSPHAATVPLTAVEEGRRTDGLPPGDERVAPQTARVSLAEMERLLRAQDEQQQPTPATPDPDPEATLVSRPAAATTRPDFAPEDYDEELTITVPRPRRTQGTGDFEATADLEATQLTDLEATRPSSYVPPAPGRVGDDRPPPDPEEDEGAGVKPPAAPAPPPAGAGVGVARRRRAWPLVVAVCVAVALVAAGGAWLAFSVLRRADVTEVPTQPAAPPPVSDDARQQFEQKLADAEALLAAGDMDGALARLRDANALDPANTRAHRRLAELLLSTGDRRGAVEELRAVARNAPDDAGAWRQLAAAQSAEGLHREAADSYRRLVALAGEGSVEPADLLSYADALRLSGRADESRPLYERLAASAPSEVASAARQRLAELARAQPTPAPTPQPGAQPSPTPGAETASVQPTAAPTVAPQPVPTAPPPTPAPAPPVAAASPAERYGRGVQLWASNRGAALEEFRAAAAGGNLDAHYYLGLSYVEGRSLGSLNRAALVAALQHFQLAQRGGQHAPQARGYAQQLEKEFDRLRNR
ncbi:MAG TPA: tetratricopeptide repeat protein [Pyrinomonadaceae bacterium]|jgi:tetratricopeptide (TPR) repeat protein